MENIIQLIIVLKDTNPLIWRRLLVDEATTFEELHYIIQISMGWTNSHLYEFNIDGYRIAELNEEFDADFEVETVDATTTMLHRVITEKNEKFEYIYDFGDSWKHEITAEKFLLIDPKIKYPTCVAGELSCPPEDCGGIGGFYYMLDAINKKQHPEKKEFLEWLGPDYDPKHFDKDEINKKLSSLDDYIKNIRSNK